MMRLKNSPFLSALVLLGLLTGSGCSIFQGNPPGSQGASHPGAGSAVHEPQPSENITAKGVVESERKADIGSRIEGTITDIAVQEGQKVKPGQLLVVFDDHKMQAQVRLDLAGVREAAAHLKELKAGSRSEEIDRARSEANEADAVYNRAKEEYDRQNHLYEVRAAPLVDLQNAEEKMKVAAEQVQEMRAKLRQFETGNRKEDIEQAEASLEHALSQVAYDRALLNDYRILSPMSGLVTDKLREAGETVNTGAPIIRIINPGKLRVRVELDESDVGKVHMGEEAEFSGDNPDSKIHPWHGKVYKILTALKRKSIRNFDPLASNDVNTENIYVKPEETKRLESGMTVTVRFLK